MKPEQRRSVIYSQNFLTRPALVRQIIDTSSIAADDLVIEIGPGKGILTRELAQRSRQVLTVERDPRLAHRLGRDFQSTSNVVVFEGDILEMPLPLTPFKVFSNIPFNITAAIVNRLTDAANPPDEASLIVQREAAERFIGARRETLTSILLKPWFEVSITHWFRSTDFAPSPRVDVVLLRFSKRGPPLLHKNEQQLYRDFVTYGFTAWQPTLRDAYRGVLTEQQLSSIVARTCPDLGRKPSQVPFQAWLLLFRAFSANSTSQQRGIVSGAEDRLREQQRRLVKSHRTRSGRRN